MDCSILAGHVALGDYPATLVSRPSVWHASDGGATHGMLLRRWCALTLYALWQPLKRPSQYDSETLSGSAVPSFRHGKESFEDDVMGVCTGLWNLVPAY